MQRKKNKATEMISRDASRVREVMSKKTFCVGCKLSYTRSSAIWIEWGQFVISWSDKWPVWWFGEILLTWKVDGLVAGSDLVGKDSGGGGGLGGRWGELKAWENRVITPPSGMNIHTTHSNSTHINILMDLSRESAQQASLSWLDLSFVQNSSSPYP